MSASTFRRTTITGSDLHAGSIRRFNRLALRHRGQREVHVRQHADLLHRRAVRKREQERRQAQHADVRFVVEVFLRAAFPVRAIAEHRAPVIARDRACDHLRRARAVSVDEH